MTAALWLVTAISACHIAEEYLWPGGFLDAMRHTAPAFLASPRELRQRRAHPN